MASKPDPDAGFDVTDRAQLLRHSAPMFTAMWLHDFLGKVDVGMPELVNSDCEDLEFHTIIFPLTNRSEEHTSELQSLMRISYAVFCLKKKNNNTIVIHTNNMYANNIDLSNHSTR